MLRRIALAMTLITGSLQAGDAPPPASTECSGAESDRREGEDELAVRSDGTIARWDLVRLVLPDLGASGGDPEWLETPSGAGSTGPLSLRTLGGRAIVGADGAALGIVRGCLVHTGAGRVLALDVDAGPTLAGEPRRIALPWSQVELAGGSMRLAGDAEWIRAAPSIPAG